MKLIAKILVFIFIAFLLTPTVVWMVDESKDISMFYDFSEEEIVKKEIKNYLHLDFNFETFFLSKLTSRIILSENLSKHETFNSTIFIPPPDQV